jgi:gliding motility-associated-like protein
MKYFLLVCGCVYGLFTIAQPEKNNWYFGDRSAISFESGKAMVMFDNPQDNYGPTASISHPQTGKLFFYTNGKKIWNGKHQEIGLISGVSGSIGDVLIVPDPSKMLQYVIILTEGSGLKYVVIDLNQPGGGMLFLSPITILDNQLSEFEVVYHPYRKAFWVISHTVGSSEFNASLVNELALVEHKVVSVTGSLPQTYGDMVANNAGNKLVVTHYTYTENNNNIEVFNFDPICGSLSNRRLLPKEDSWDHPYGAAFSPDDSKLFITFSFGLSQLIQYYGTDFQNNQNIASSPDNFNILRLGNDGKIYIATHDGGIPGPRIDAILDPNILAACKYTKTYLTTDNGSGRNANFELPTFAKGKRFTSPTQDSIFTYSNTCLGQSTQFKFNPANIIDSLVWYFGEGSDSSQSLDATHQYQQAGEFVVSLILYRCGNTFVLKDTVTITEIPVIAFAPDTILCNGTTLRLSAPQSDKYLWSTGETTPSIQVTKPGLVWLYAKNGMCSNSDSITVSFYPDIFTALGDEYFICDDDKELVKLDAGQDFAQYKWTPTGDTTQWIIVGDVGKYFVVVKDYRGCDGSDGTKVQRRCPVSVFYPSAFTPNNDGVNDVFLPIGSDVVEFKLTIYNGWGQLIFESKSIEKGWDGKVDGKPAPVGTYVYQSTYSGYRNKRLVEFDTKGNVTLLR